MSPSIKNSKNDNKTQKNSKNHNISSTSASDPITRKSMLVNSYLNKYLSTIPSTYTPNITQLNLSHNRIYELQGIDKYLKLQKLNLSHNLIDNVNQLNILSCLQELEELRIEENPICDIVNYRYLVMIKVPQLNFIDGIKISPYGFLDIRKWQHEIGYKMLQFQFQKCQLLESISPSLQTIQELKSISQALHSLQKQNYSNNSLLLFNNFLTDLFPLQSIISIQPGYEQSKQIEQYLFESIIKIGAKNQPRFIDRLLSKIEVNNTGEQERIKNDGYACLLILAKQLKKQYEFGCLFEKDNTIERGQPNIKHYISADTAMDSNDRVSNNHSFIHFTLDEEYLSILSTLLQREMKSTITVLESKQSQEFQQLSNEQQLPLHENHQTLKLYSHFTSEQQLQQTDPLQSYLSSHKTQQNHPYTNPYILSNILDSLHSIFLKIIFSRIKYHRNKYSINLQNNQQFIPSLVSYQNSILSENLRIGLEAIKNQALEDLTIQMKEELQYKKLRRMFLAWKKIKARKMKLLLKLIRKKSRDDRFLMDIALQKWKLNSRAKRLKKMTSQVLLKVSHSSKLPVSKKGIDLAYKRVSSRYH